ncbi:MAG: CDP-glycerol glycerophosphotransferase family protein [Plesiomonas sp.]|uniref:CDP-glycerol glycerophosphotransferase family protein n=1 Tax=Plesiomonas sp. TaxID=2486279 RepID=UPI003F3A3B69
MRYIQKKYKNNTKFSLVKFLHHKYKYTVFQGFDYAFRGNSKYLFLSLLSKGVQHLKFITESELVPRHFRVKPYSSEHMYYLANAKTVYLESYEELNFSVNPKTELIQMWHGIPLKLMMLDSFEKSKPGVAQKKLNNMKRWDVFYYTGDYSKNKFKSAFELNERQFIEKTPPRLSFMSKCNQSDIRYFKDKYKIPRDKFIISYFPTWRDSWKKTQITHHHY